MFWWCGGVDDNLATVRSISDEFQCSLRTQRQAPTPPHHQNKYHPGDYVLWNPKEHPHALRSSKLAPKLLGPYLVIYPRYYCSKCKRTKSSLVTEDLLQMGVPYYVIRRCPVVVKRKTAYTQNLVDSILTMMTGSLGAEQISNFIKSNRSSLWSSHALVYLEVMADLTKNSLQNFTFTAPATAAFPALLTHCHGYGGNSGVSKQAIQRLFIGMSKMTAAIGDRVMMSLGAQVISGDHTFNVPSRIKTKDKANNT